ncbi:tetraprenyl-beta-curcumene synthase family protein [Oceanobacillus jordanicus]|uniref:Tetraprenyl-beta-curcumene synthase family protein n=1 Tax=Oceanobacillus jordanicus TaxID=2867266 RepID=A0AAW5B8N4_9BACI|nr:tetraprenyl-beta-curcumene synthase family protein [Oceanobacillus jordanicus]MCG3419584.1 tetraprenyl-beta-curcumene synthase family protein [Oceanobacillus jordanicus]
MRNNVPTSSIRLLKSLQTNIFPEVEKELNYWTAKARAIPNQELRNQALASIGSKKFHCQGGAVYALLAGERSREAIKFIVAYQTISDYLDNLCDRSTSLDPADFRLLHESLFCALNPDQQTQNYYALREDQNDNGYLHDLVRTCQVQLALVERHVAQPFLNRLVSLYTDLQVHKHVDIRERVPRLENWFKEENEDDELAWYEFAAASGSTLTVFCLVSYLLGGKLDEPKAKSIFEGYFPYLQGLHIMLDYYIDQKEDVEAEDLNFCFYYPNEEKMSQRLSLFIQKAADQVQPLPDNSFHQMIRQGLVGLYLADPKVKHLTNETKLKKHLLKTSGTNARLFHLFTKLYYKMKK